MSVYTKQRAADVLLATSDIDTLGQIRHSLQKSKVVNRLHHVGEPQEAKTYLRQDVPYTQAPAPGLVLLDASLPDNDLVDLITEVKTNPQFAGIALVVIAATDPEMQFVESGMYRPDGVIRKPFDIRELIPVLISVSTLSFQLVQSASPA